LAKAPNGKIPLLKKIIRSMRRPQGKIRLLALLLCIALDKKFEELFYF